MSTCKAIAHQSILCPICKEEGYVTNSRRKGDVRVRWRRCNCVGEITWKTTEGEAQPQPEMDQRT